MSKFNMFGDDCSSRVWRRVGKETRRQCFKPKVKHKGANVMVWGCMSVSGVGRLRFIEGNMNDAYYGEIFASEMLPSAA